MSIEDRTKYLRGLTVGRLVSAAMELAGDEASHAFPHGADALYYQRGDIRYEKDSIDEGDRQDANGDRCAALDRCGKNQIGRIDPLDGDNRNCIAAEHSAVCAVAIEEARGKYAEPKPRGIGYHVKAAGLHEEIRDHD